MQTVSCKHTSFELIKFLQEEGMDYQSSLTDLYNLKSVTIHNRHGELPSLFIPLKGEKSDGHMYLYDFLKSNPENVALCGEHFKSNVDQSLASRVIFVRDTLKALQTIARGYRKTLDTNVLGITGSSGKTTFKFLLQEVFKQKINTYVSPGNLNNHIGVPLAVLGIPKDVPFALIEMGMNHPGEVAELSQICMPNVGIIVNVGPAHIGFFESVEDIAGAKAELFSYVHRQDGDNYALQKYRKLFSRHIQKHVTWIEDNFLLHGIHFQEPDKVSDGQSRMSLYDVGITPESNTLAMGVASHYGISSKEYWEGLKQFSKLDKGLRGALYKSGPHVVFLDCYNANPDSFSYSIERAKYFASHYDTNAFVGWYGDMRELGKMAPGYHAQIIQLLLNTHFPQKDVKMRFFGDNFKSVLEGERSKLLSSGPIVDIDAFDSTDVAEEILSSMLNATHPTFFHVKGSRYYQLEDTIQKLLPREKNLMLNHRDSFI